MPSDATVVSLVRSPQLFGLGLIDNISDAPTFWANAAASKKYGIAGVANMVEDEMGVVRPGRFGQKLDSVTLFQFTANAEFNELGITTSNSLFGVASAFQSHRAQPAGIELSVPRVNPILTVRRTSSRST